MTREEMKEKILADKELTTRLIIFTNLAYALIDVADAYLCEVEGVLRKAHMNANQDVKKRIGFAKNTAKQLRSHISFLLDDVNGTKSKPVGEDFHNDFDLTSDFLYDMVLLLADRVGDNADVGTLIRAQIFNNKSQGKFYELLRPKL